MLELPAEVVGRECLAALRKGVDDFLGVAFGLLLLLLQARFAAHPAVVALPLQRPVAQMALVEAVAERLAAFRVDAAGHDVQMGMLGIVMAGPDGARMLHAQMREHRMRCQLHLRPPRPLVPVPGEHEMEAVLLALFGP